MNDVSTTVDSVMSYPLAARSGKWVVVFLGLFLFPSQNLWDHQWRHWLSATCVAAFIGLEIVNPRKNRNQVSIIKSKQRCDQNLEKRLYDPVSSHFLLKFVNEQFHVNCENHEIHCDSPDVRYYIHNIMGKIYYFNWNITKRGKNMTRFCLWCESIDFLFEQS
jgi:hypothetical protein